MASAELAKIREALAYDISKLEEQVPWADTVMVLYVGTTDTGKTRVSVRRQGHMGLEEAAWVLRKAMDMVTDGELTDTPHYAKDPDNA